MKMKNSENSQMTAGSVRARINRLSAVLLKELSQQHKEDNFVFSPLSAYVLLSMTADATAGRAKKELTDLLCGKGDFTQTLSILVALQKKLSEKNTFSSANAVIVREDLEHSIVPGYEERLEALFDGRLFATDHVAEHVNNWVRKRTGGLIPSIADDSMEDVLLCMVNACSFLADWNTQYEWCQIENRDFHNVDQSVSRVKMLHSYEDIYIENSSFFGFAKPYKNKSHSYVVLLPKDEKRALQTFGEELDFAALIKGKDNTCADVLMPEFSCSTDTDLTNMLKGQGIRTVFTPEADFSPISSEWLKVDAIKQKANIQVDRRGTKAYVVSDERFICGAAPLEFPEEKTILVNRPFLFAVVHNETGIPVFLGAVNHLDTPEGDSDMMTNQEKEAACLPIYERICAIILDEDWVLKDCYDRSLLQRLHAAYRKLNIDELKKIETEVCRD